MEISIKSDHKRYFTNPFAHETAEVAPSVTNEWLTDKIRQLADRVHNYSIKDSDFQKGMLTLKEATLLGT